MTVPTVCLLIEVFLSRDSFLFPLCVRTSEIKKGKGGVGLSLSLSPPYFSFLSRVESCFSLYRFSDVVIRERKNGMIKRIRFLTEDGQSR